MQARFCAASLRFIVFAAFVFAALPANADIKSFAWDATTLRTDGSALTPAPAYEVGRGTASRNYTLLTRTSATSLDLDLAAGTHYLAVRAIDSAGQASAYSNEVVVTVAAPTPTPTPVPTASPTPSPTATPTATPTPSPTATATPSATPTPSPTATATPAPTATATPSATPTPSPTAPAVQLRINAGGSGYTDSTGSAWSADQYATGGALWTDTNPVNGTTDDSLYQTRRYGDFSYAIPVPNGSYNVNLYFVEQTYSTAGGRVFDVSAEGMIKLSRFDIYARAGLNNALVVPLSVDVADGVMNISFTQITGSPMISAIELKSAATPVPTPSATPSPTATATPSPTATATPAPTATPSPTPTPAAANTTLRRINTGGAAYVDNLGRSWAADSGYNTGSVYSVTSDIAATLDDQLYQNDRYGKDFTYSFAVPNGLYNVTLYFSETYWNASGQRIFSVYANGARVVTDLDIFKSAGARTPLLMPVSVNVTAGKLDLRFLATANYAKISALEIQAAEAPDIRVNAGGAAYVDTLGSMWGADRYFTGTSATSATTSGIANTLEDKLYQSERYGRDFTYSFPVPNGTYDVTLYFSELTFAAAGQRVFSVTGNGQAIATNIDIYRSAGRYAPLIIRSTATVANGKLDLRFFSSVNNAKVSAIEIRKR